MAVIPNDSAHHSVDIYLEGGQDYSLENNDLKMIWGGESTASELIRRVLTAKGSWDANREYGGQIWDWMKRADFRKFTDADMRSLIEDAARYLIETGKVKSIDDVTITGTFPKGLTVSVKLTVGGTSTSELEESIESTFLIPS